MLVTDLTRQTLSRRRTVKDWLREGFEEVNESGGKLWQLKRGARQNQKIIDVRISPDGKSVFVRIK